MPVTVNPANPSAQKVLYDVVIEPGVAPLYVIGSSYEPAIWSFTGSVQRISRVVVYGVFDQGVQGIAPEKLAIAVGSYNTGCPAKMFETDTAKAAMGKADIGKLIGHAVDLHVGARFLEQVSIPSMKVTYGGPPAVPPAAAIQLDPESVLFGNSPAMMPQRSSRSAADQPTPPRAAATLASGQDGIDQLVASGAMTRISGQNYRLVRAIPRWPEGLSDMSSISVVVAAGVPVPVGDMGTTCVVDERTSAVVSRGTCQ